MVPPRRVERPDEGRWGRFMETIDLDIEEFAGDANGVQPKIIA